MRIDLPVKGGLLPHCRAQIAAGADPAQLVQVWRGATLCFAPASLGAFAALATEEGEARSIRLRKWRALAPQGGEYAPVAAETAGAGHE